MTPTSSSPGNDGEPPLAAGSVYRFGPFVLDSRRRTLCRADSPVSLSAKAFDVLVFLIQPPHQPLANMHWVWRLFATPPTGWIRLRYRVLLVLCGREVATDLNRSSLRRLSRVNDRRPLQRHVRRCSRSLPGRDGS